MYTRIRESRAFTILFLSLDIPVLCLVELDRKTDLSILYIYFDPKSSGRRNTPKNYYAQLMI